MTTDEWNDVSPTLEQQVWKRYGNFELSHDKNELIVKNIIEFIKGYSKSKVEEALKLASEKATATGYIVYVDPYDFSQGINGAIGCVNKQSILNVINEINFE